MSLQLIKNTGKENFTCEMCKKMHHLKLSYRIQSTQYVSDWTPPILYPVCRNCTYREQYGTKTYKKHMKEKTLDG